MVVGLVMVHGQVLVMMMTMMMMMIQVLETEDLLLLRQEALGKQSEVACMYRVLICELDALGPWVDGRLVSVVA